MYRIEGSPRNDNTAQSYDIQRELDLLSASGAMNLAYEVFAPREVSRWRRGSAPSSPPGRAAGG